MSNMSNTAGIIQKNRESKEKPLLITSKQSYGRCAPFSNARTFSEEVRQTSLFNVACVPDEERDTENNLQQNISGGFRFIDLFAGIGGFHIAAHDMGGTCVFSSEFNGDARCTYEKNFHKENVRLFSSGNFRGDITNIHENEIPSFDFLFAGFPCQPFSKGGQRRGFEDTRGTLFFDVARIIEKHKPPFLLLENVPNLVSHDGGRTFKIITTVLEDLGYVLNKEPLVLSPHQFGIPVIRQRIYIPAIRKDILGGDHFLLDFSSDFKDVKEGALFDIMDIHEDSDRYRISDYEERVLDVWNDFYKGIDLDVIGFPVWSEEFTGNGDISELPEWKQSFILKNRALYERNKDFIDDWLQKNDNLLWMVPTHRKMEWQAGADIADIYEGLIQFRPSGVRVKRPDKFSTLVAMNHPQIVGKYKRRLTPNEVKRLQSFPEHFILHKSDPTALRQLGNAVNVDVVKYVIRQMFATLASVNIGYE